jgi:hypothetical protein
MVTSVLQLREKCEKEPKRLHAMRAGDAAFGLIQQSTPPEAGKCFGFPPYWRIYGRLFGNRFATVGNGGAISLQFIHATTNKNFLPTKTLRKDAGRGGEI